MATSFLEPFNFVLHFAFLWNHFMLIASFQAPLFTMDLPNVFEFSNSSGGKLPCSTRGIPEPTITWLFSDGTPISNLPNLRQVMSDGTLIFPPFKSEDYRQDVHAVLYRCSATNPLGTLISNEVQVRGVVIQSFDVYVYDVYVIRGNAAVMRCHVPDFLVNYITVTAWIRDSVVYITKDNLDPSSKYFLLPSGDLLVQNVSLNDGVTSFRCQVTNRLTARKKTSIAAGRLILTESKGNVPPKIVHSISEIYAEEGKPTILPCVAHGFPTPVCRWSKQLPTGHVIPLDEGIRFKRISGSLLIESVEVSDSGIYICTAVNQHGTDRVTIYLQVKVPLSVTISPREAKVDADHSIVFTCNYSGFPSPTLTWMKDGKILSRDGIFQPQNNTIHIAKMKSNHVGIYQCFLTNAFESVYGTALLQLGDVTPEIVNGFDEQVLQPGEGTILECEAKGNPLPEITWTLDNMEIPRNGRINVEVLPKNSDRVIGRLILNNAKPEDGGLYRCVVSSHAGRNQHQARVNVFGRPRVRSHVKIFATAQENVQLDCPVYGYPIKAINWEKHSTSLPENIHQLIHKNGTLTIVNVQKMTDSGKYTCIVKGQEQVTARADVELIVMVPPKITPFSFQDEQIREGTRARIQCAVSEGEAPLKLTWLKDGRPIPSELGVNIRDLDEFSSILMISSITPRHNGNYTCFASNVAGQARHTAPLFVNVPARWVNAPQDVTGANGENLYVHCQAEGYPTPSITWNKAFGDDLDSRRMPVHNTNYIHTFSNGTLMFRQLQKSDQGYYFCVASNNIGKSLSKAIYITVQASPEFDTKNEELIVKKGSEVRIPCHANGDTPINYIWSVNDHNIDGTFMNHRYKVESISKDANKNGGQHSELVIAWVDKKDSTIFTCTSENKIGKDEMQIKLIVQEPPEKPILNKSKVINQTIVLNWTSPYDGNSPILRYVIEYKEKNGKWEDNKETLSISGRSNATSVQGLKAAKFYEFRILAENAVGNSSYSEVIEVKTDESTPGGPPQNVEVESTDARTLRVTWKPPRKHLWNGAIIGYNVGYKIHTSPDDYTYDQLEVPEDYTEDLIYQLTNLQMYTQYNVIVRAYNTKGFGPSSEPALTMTSEDIPSSAPEGIRCSALSAKSIYVLWDPLPPENLNGILRGYRVLYKPAEEWYDAMMQSKNTQHSKITLHDMDVNTNYSIQVAAFTKVGDGPRSKPVFCKTHEDVPQPPTDVRVLPSSADSVVVSWKPSKKPNGAITMFNVYYKPVDDESRLPLDDQRDATIRSSQSDAQYVEVSGLRKNRKYAFWVTATSVIGESPSSSIVAQTVADSKIPAKAASFHDVVKTPWKRDIVMPCKAVGVPPPHRTWTVGNEPVAVNDRVSIAPDGTLTIAMPDAKDSGNYSCSIFNDYGRDEVRYNVLVQVPPEAPFMEIGSKSRSSIQVQWKPGSDGGDRIRGYILYYKRETDKYITKEIRPEKRLYTLDGLACGATYQLYMQAFNSIGISEPCDVIAVNTEGSDAMSPSKEDLIREGSTFITVHLDSWPIVGCPVQYFGVEYRTSSVDEWKIVGANIPPSQKKLVISGLSPATWHVLRLTVQTRGNSKTLQYKFATLTAIGGTIPPEIIAEYIPPYAFLLDPVIFIPVVAFVIIIIIVTVVLCCYFRQRSGSIGVPSEASDPYSRINTWIRSTRAMAMRNYNRASDRTHHHSDGRRRRRRRSGDPSPYATTHMSDCYPDGIPNSSGSKPQSSRPSVKKRQPSETICSSAIYPPPSSTSAPPPFPGPRIDSLQQNTLDKTNEPTFSGGRPNLNHPGWATPVKQPQRTSDIYDPPPASHMFRNSLPSPGSEAASEATKLLMKRK